MDEIDLQIIRELTKDSRSSFSKIAKKIGVSTETVIRRFSMLESEEGIRPVLVVNHEKLGYEAQAVYFIRTVSHADLSGIVEQISKTPDIMTITVASGMYDIMTIALVRGIKHSFKIGEELEKIEGIAKVTIDLYYLPPDDCTSFPPDYWRC